MAMDWMRLLVPPADASRFANLESRFETAFQVAGAPPNAALFEDMSNASPGARDYYFSPGAVAFFGSMLTRAGATPSEPPKFANAALIIGRADAAGRLLPDASP